jgi:hypothetical protein
MFECNVCHKHFRQKTNRDIHVSTHSPNLQPVLCGKGEYEKIFTFAIKTNIKSHGFRGHVQISVPPQHNFCDECVDVGNSSHQPRLPEHLCIPLIPRSVNLCIHLYSCSAEWDCIHVRACIAKLTALGQSFQAPDPETLRGKVRELSQRNAFSPAKRDDLMASIDAAHRLHSIPVVVCSPPGSTTTHFSVINHNRREIHRPGYSWFAKAGRCSVRVAPDGRTSCKCGGLCVFHSFFLP